MNFKRIFFIVLLALNSCNDRTISDSKKDGTFTNGATTLFSKVKPEVSGISFQNKVIQTYDFNFLNYTYIYTGGGVAIGDIDNDGLEDLYLVSNFGPNKLYKNEGDFSFQDITSASQAEDYSGFSTGVSMLDINSDGWLDIYVCKAGSLKDDSLRRNLLFINRKDGSFNEEAANWNLNDPGFSTQAYPLDYDKDGDLDLYVVNHRYDFKNVDLISGEVQRAIEEVTSDQLYRNDGTTFTKVTGTAGLYNKAWGLSAVISDFNEDGWDDIYVANDFLEPDILYINQQNGTFKNEINQRMSHIPFYSMGSDFADINNDLLPDLINVDMTSSDHVRSKENMASMDTEAFQNLVKVGYHHAYMANTLQVNNGLGKFTETAQLTGISKTDWSWAPLLADFDNDGLKDLFVTNGVEREYNNQDAKAALRKKQQSGVAMALEEVLNTFPSEKIPNHIYQNKGNLTFENKIEAWGMSDATLSNGAAYADLDNDGDLDLVINNLNDAAGIFKNNANHNYIQVKLKGPKNNLQGLGSNIFVFTQDQKQLQEIYPTRGYESSVPAIANFGLGTNNTIDKLLVQWPDGKISKLNNLEANQVLTVDYTSATLDEKVIQKTASKKQVISPNELGINYIHKENDVNDYALQLLIPQKQSTKGTGIVTADINGDGLEDFFVGNAKDASAASYLQNNDGTFSINNEKLWKSEAKYEDASALFFDYDMDGDQDLYVVSAGYELPQDSPMLQDRLYKNDGTGNFRKTKNILPSMFTSGKSVVAGDYDQDGDLDLYLGGNVIPGHYPNAPASYLLNNDNGIFKDVTTLHTALTEIGMVSQSLFTDYDGDNDLDLLVVGEWMAPTFFNNHNGVFTKAEGISGLDNTEGWWFSTIATDFDNDGDEDYVLGNVGGNNKFHPSAEKPLFIYAKDFDANGTYDIALSKTNKGKLVPIRGKECSSEQNPFLLDKIKTYKEFASLEMKDIYGEDEIKGALQLKAHLFKSVYLENEGNGSFKVTKLPNMAQTGPTLSMVTEDFNKDGHLDIMGFGAIYDTEVETIRYDSNYGYVLLGDGNGNFDVSTEHQPFIDKDTKDATTIEINGKKYYIVVSNNAPLDIFAFRP